MARSRLSLPAIIDQALTVADGDGFAALSLSTVADRLGVGPSALYTHVDGLQGLQYLVAVASTGNLGGAVRDAAIGTAGPAALTAMGQAYRTFALDHPGQFASTLLPLRANDDELARANQRLLDVFVAVYAAMGLSPAESHLAARSMRSAVHGFLALEHCAGTMTASGDEYDHLLRALQRGLIGAG